VKADLTKKKHYSYAHASGRVNKQLLKGMYQTIQPERFTAHSLTIRGGRYNFRASEEQTTDMELRATSLFKMAGDEGNILAKLPHTGFNR